MMEIETRIAGIPCVVTLDYYEPPYSASRNGHPDTWEPDDPAELDYTICDRRGRPAPWLSNKLTDKEQDRIEQELIEAIKETA